MVKKIVCSQACMIDVMPSKRYRLTGSIRTNDLRLLVLERYHRILPIGKIIQNTVCPSRQSAPLWETLLGSITSVCFILHQRRTELSSNANSVTFDRGSPKETLPNIHQRLEAHPLLLTSRSRWLEFQYYTSGILTKNVSCPWSIDDKWS